MKEEIIEKHNAKILTTSITYLSENKNRQTTFLFSTNWGTANHFQLAQLLFLERSQPYFPAT